MTRSLNSLKIFYDTDVLRSRSLGIGFEIILKRSCHRRGRRRRSLYVKTQTCVTGSLGRCGAETSYLYVTLLEVREVFQEGLDSRGAEKYEHVIVKRLVRPKIIAHSPVHDSLGIIDTVLVKESRVFFVDIAHHPKELFLLVLGQRREKTVELTGLAVEYLTFTVYYVFLQIERYGLGGAEIFHRVRDSDTHIITQAEEVVYGGAGREDDCRKVVDGNFGLAEFLGGKAFHLDERSENHLYAITFGNVIVGGLA